MQEIWKDIDNYEGYYQVSNFGKIKSLDRTCWNGQAYHKVKGRTLKPHNNKYGYARVILCKSGVCVGCLVNRAVATAFLENSNDYPCTNHKDENPRNNHVDNLEWCTYSYNNTYGTKIARKVAHTDWKSQGLKHGKTVIQKDMDGDVIKIWASATECLRALGYDNSTIARCCRGLSWMAYGYRWEYCA